MIEKKLLQPNRVRHIDGGFSFIPHRFLADGFLASLTQKEILLYLFLVLASDRPQHRYQIATRIQQSLWEAEGDR